MNPVAHDNLDRSNEARRPSREGKASPLPSFLIIGAAKSGTSTLYQHLARHPEICMSSISEPSFFSDDDAFARGIDWYRSLFASWRPGQICGEKSTGYARWPEEPEAPQRIASALPEVKLLYIMRHPVDRAYSHYVHRVAKELHRGERISIAFSEHVRDDTICINSGFYMRQIERYLDHFDRSSVHLMLFDDLIADREGAIDAALEFIGLKTHMDVYKDGDIKKNTAARNRYHSARQDMMRPIRKLPGVRSMRGLVPRSLKDGAYSLISRSPYGRRVAGAHTPPPLKSSERRELLATYRDENARLAEFLGRDLSHWND